MTEKRFTFTQDTLAKADVFDGNEFVCCTLSVWVEQLVALLNQLNDENEQLKKELAKFKEWEKHIRDVKREELDRVFKMSIYEIAEAFEYYKKRINELKE